MKASYVSSSLSYRTKTLLNFLILRKLRSTLFLPLYNSLSYFHGLLRLLFGGTTGRIPHFFAFARQESPSYALSMRRGLSLQISFGTLPSTPDPQDRLPPNPAISDALSANRHPQRWHESLWSSLHDSCRWTAPLFLRSTGAIGMDFDVSAV